MGILIALTLLLGIVIGLVVGIAIGIASVLPHDRNAIMGRGGARR